MQYFNITIHLANGEVYKTHTPKDYQGMHEECGAIHTYAQLVKRLFRRDSGHRLVRYTVEEEVKKND